MAAWVFSWKCKVSPVFMAQYSIQSYLLRSGEAIVARLPAALHFARVLRSLVNISIVRGPLLCRTVLNRSNQRIKITTHLLFFDLSAATIHLHSILRYVVASVGVYNRHRSCSSVFRAYKSGIAWKYLIPYSSDLAESHPYVWPHGLGTALSYQIEGTLN